MTKVNIENKSECCNKKFLFKCDLCEKILNVTFDSQKDIIDTVNEHMLMQCFCEGYYFVLLN